jgi:predicted transcriptional regulator
MREKIISQLSESPKTIPEIAEALDYPRYEVMLWIMAMWRYGYLEEIGKPNADGYYAYRLTE